MINLGNVARWRHGCNGRLIGNRMWPIEWHHYRWPLVTLKVTFAVWNLSILYTSDMQCVLSTIYLHMNRKALPASNFNCFFEIEGFLQVTASHIHCKCGNISQMVPDSTYVAYCVYCCFYHCIMYWSMQLQSCQSVYNKLTYLLTYQIETTNRPLTSGSDIRPIE